MQIKMEEPHKTLLPKLEPVKLRAQMTAESAYRWETGKYYI